eukprot:7616133-Alexandrium_andersonii.AAC.1
MGGQARPYLDPHRCLLPARSFVSLRSLRLSASQASKARLSAPRLSFRKATGAIAIDLRLPGRGRSYWDAGWTWPTCALLGAVAKNR